MTSRASIPSRRPRAAVVRRARARGRAGMTLIEIMVVVVLIAMMAAGATFGVNSLPRARLRTTSARIASTFHFAYVHALTTGRPTRVSFPMGTADIAVEDTEQSHVLDRNDPLHAGGAADVEQQAIASARLQTELRPRVSRATFHTVPANVFRRRPPEQGIAIVRLYSQHDAEPREQGVGHVYFFPGGQAERAVVQIRNDRGEMFSVLLHPLTGRTEIFDRPIEPPVVEDRAPSDETETDERERVPEQSAP